MLWLTPWHQLMQGSTVCRRWGNGALPSRHRIQRKFLLSDGFECYLSFVPGFKVLELEKQEMMQEAGGPRLLQLGCGLCAPPEWVNVDGSSNAWLAQHPKLKAPVRLFHLVPADKLNVPWPRSIKIANLKKRLPFESESFDAVYASHVLEHLYRNEALALLREAYRVLKKGGRCRMLVPDLQALIREYLGEGT